MPGDCTICQYSIRRPQKGPILQMGHESVTLPLPPNSQNQSSADVQLVGLDIEGIPTFPYKVIKSKEFMNVHVGTAPKLLEVGETIHSPRKQSCTNTRLPHCKPTCTCTCITDILHWVEYYFIMSAIITLKI